MFAVFSPFFIIRNVRIYGLSDLTPAEAQKTISLAAFPPKTNIFRLPEKKLESSILSQAFIQKVQFKRIFPQSISIDIISRQPVATLAVQNGIWQMDDAGRIIRSGSRRGLTPIYVSGKYTVTPGEIPSSPTLAGAILAINTLKGWGCPAIQKIEVDQNADMCLNMEGELSIQLGQTDHMDTKLAAIRRIYALSPSIASTVRLINLTCSDHVACVPRTNASNHSVNPDSSGVGQAVVDPGTPTAEP
jgi:cell division septal protein FtsQ